jgi:hypothetical protein
MGDLLPYNSKSLVKPHHPLAKQEPVVIPNPRKKRIPRSSFSATRRSYAEGYRKATVTVVQQVQAMLRAGTPVQEALLRLKVYEDELQNARDEDGKMLPLALTSKELKALPPKSS